MLVVERYEDVSFQGYTIRCAVTRDGEKYFSPRHFCRDIGIGWPAQFEKIKEDAKLGKRYELIKFPAENGKMCKMVCLPIEYLPGWMFTVKKVGCVKKIIVGEFKIKNNFSNIGEYHD